MSLKCSIFGHRFGDPVVERSRDESGSEVVITIQEIQTCGRCGHERVVSENKEVTTLETPDDGPAAPAADEPDAATESAGDAEAAAPADPSPPADEGATILEDDEPVVAEAESDAPEEPAAQADSRSAAVAESEPTAPEDDAVILEDEDDAEPERAPGQWPEEPDDAGEDDWEPPAVEDAEAASESATATESSPTVEPTGEAVTVPEGTFRCPSCGFTTPVESSSLREGDFCPECHTGSLTHERE